MHLMEEMSGEENQHIQKDKQVLESMNVERQYPHLPPLAFFTELNTHGHTIWSKLLPTVHDNSSKVHLFHHNFLQTELSRRQRHEER